MKKNLEDNGWKHVSRAEYESTVSRLADIYAELPVQLIHRDIHFGNFLFADGSFSGYIDFDLSQRNIRVFDICYFLLGLLSRQEELEITEEKWLEYLRDVFQGYERVLTLSQTEKRAVPYVMECIELLFTAYFEGVGDSLGAEDACQIYTFIKKRENIIWSYLL